MNIEENTQAGTQTVGASIFVPVSATRLYEVLLDVRNFPRWAPLVQQVEVIDRPGEPGMVSEWELAFLGVRKKVLSVLETAEPPRSLRWSYHGPLRGWGECGIRDQGTGVVASFATDIQIAEPKVEKLARKLPAQGIANSHLKRALVRLGHLACGQSAGVRVGPLQSAA